MEKVFEDLFSENQADMVSICLEYVNGVADKIYIYCSFEKKVIAVDYFYCINNNIKRKNKINEIDTVIYDISPNRQIQVLKILGEDLKKIIDLCEEYKREMPTEMKLIFDVKTQKFKAEYSYEIKYSYSEDRSASDVFNEWFEEIKNASEPRA